MAKAANQGDLFGAVTPLRPAPAKSYEQHEHVFIRGPRAGSAYRNKIVHSHEGGDVPHAHPDTGPGSYVIDKDEWYRATGMRGGGRKTFTKQPEGEQLPYILRTPEENSFEVHVGPNPPGWEGSGGGMATAARMMLACKMTVSKVVPFEPKRKRA